MEALTQFIKDNARMIARNDTSHDDKDPQDIVFGKIVYIGKGTVEEFTKLVQESTQGYFGTELNPFDDQLHDYTELGAWLGDQGLALSFMGLAAHFKKANIVTAKTMFKHLLGIEMSETQERAHAGQGKVAITSQNIEKLYSQMKADLSLS